MIGSMTSKTEGTRGGRRYRLKEYTYGSMCGAKQALERFERDLDVFVPEGTILTAVMNYSIFIWVEVK